MPPKVESLTAVFNRERWRPADSADGNDFVIADVLSNECGKEKLSVTILGNAKQGDLIWNLPYTFYGRWEDDPRAVSVESPQQFRFNSFRQLEPATREGIIQYLRRFANGIGAGIGGRLFDSLGPDAVKILRTDPTAAAASINNGRVWLTDDAARSAAAALKQVAEYEDVKIELANLFAGRGFPGKLIDEVIRRWKAVAPARVKRDPFSLLVHKLPGCGFARCDRLYLDLGLPAGRLKRQLLCLWHALRTDNEGHTWRPEQTLEKRLGELVGGAKLQPKRAIRLGVKSRWLAYRQGPTNYVAEYRKADNERTLAATIRGLLSDPDTQWPGVAGIAGLSAHQREIVAKSLSGRVGVLAGTPGTGKTYTAAAVIRAIVDAVGSNNVAIAAPTGKAAVRCTAAMQGYGLTIEATTIHRLLGVNRNGHDGDGWGFEHDENNPLDFRFVVIDEVSMLDTDLAASLFRSLRPGTHVLLVGDPYQLPPVGHGAPLRDMIAAGLPYGELSEVRRNDGSIVQACRAIKEGKSAAPPADIDVGRGRNWRHIEAHKPAFAMMRLESLLSSCPAGIDPIWDCQVIVAVNEKTEVSRQACNKFLQGLLNPRGGSGVVNGSKFRIGDKVICTSNTMLQLAIDADGKRVDDGAEILEFVANGEIGRVAAMDDKGMQVAFDCPRRTVAVLVRKRKAKQSGSDSTDGDNGNDGGNEIQATGSGCDFDLAYAVTCHKCQGSQVRIVIVMLDSSNGANYVCSREWLYTALSRAESLVITIGELATMRRQSRRVAIRDRVTYLKEMLSR